MLCLGKIRPSRRLIGGAKGIDVAKGKWDSTDTKTFYFSSQIPAWQRGFPFYGVTSDLGDGYDFSLA
jgi:hypothetical protein